MSRFQAKTNVLLDQELEALREEFGLRPNQKADLLRELTALAFWVIRQSEAGRIVEARGEDGVQPLVHPVVDRLRQRGRQRAVEVPRLTLSDWEVERLAEILERGFSPTAELTEIQQRFDAAVCRPPAVTWKAPSE